MPPNRNGPNIQYGNFWFDPISGFPVPQVSISQNVNRSSAGVVIGYESSVTLEGIIYGFTGYNNDCQSPSQLDQDTGFAFLMEQVETLSKVFSSDFKALEITCSTDEGDQVLLSADGTGNVTKVNSINFNQSQDLWAITVPYSIEIGVITSSGIAGGGEGYPSGGNRPYFISNYTDNIQINVDTSKSYYLADGNNPIKQPFPNPFDSSTSFDGGSRMVPFESSTGYPVYTVTRTIGAVGIATSGLNQVENAKDWVANQLLVYPIGTLTQDLDLYNRERNISSDEAGGSYQVTETYLATRAGTQNGYLETFEVSQDISTNGNRTVTIAGQIQGLECGNIGIEPPVGTYTGVVFPTHTGTSPDCTKYDNALSGYLIEQSNFFQRCINTMPYYQPVEDTSKFFTSPNFLNPNPTNKRDGFNPANGTVSYTWSYDNRPGSLIDGAQGERLDINDNYAVRSVANVYVIGRRLGPVTQDLGTYTKPTRRVTYSARFPRPSGFEGYNFDVLVTNDIVNLVALYDPARVNPTPTSGPVVSNIRSDNYSFNPIDASVSYTVEWEYTKCN
jgi:hypothetical protein